MTFQSKSHLLKHATSHHRKTQIIAAINSFLKSFGASIGKFRLGDSYKSKSKSLHSTTESDEIKHASIKLSVENLPKPHNLEAAAAEAAFVFGDDITDDFVSEDHSPGRIQQEVQTLGEHNGSDTTEEEHRKRHGWKRK